MDILECKNPSNVLKIIATKQSEKSNKYVKITVRPIVIKGDKLFQAEMFTEKQAFHQNFPCEQLNDWVQEHIVGQFCQILVMTENNDVTYLTSKKGKISRICKQRTNQPAKITTSNNRVKNYLINEGDNVPVLCELGIFTSELKVAAKMYDKFKQINRFLEILDDVFADYPSDTLTMLDFGCGKAYLSFLAYYYFSTIKHLDVEIVGYDLKTDVVEHCNALAQKYGYNKLHFEVADITKDKLSEKHIDVVLSLHACDIATDYALEYAIKHKIKYIFSVPCCQHEINSTIHFGGDLDILLKYGIVKERASALLTDSVRASILEDVGYKVDVMEFVDLAHSPKNLMIRAVLKSTHKYKNKEAILRLQAAYGFRQSLATLIYGNGNN